ncbi:MAG: 30S ribosomal protein S9, partial [Candidatus Sungbacteria bacterium]|nr:30S ribosomal protein S9 [Candidatus Sungbacteria bacterium]
MPTKKTAEKTTEPKAKKEPKEKKAPAKKTAKAKEPVVLKDLPKAVEKKKIAVAHEKPVADILPEGVQETLEVGEEAFAEGGAEDLSKPERYWEAVGRRKTAVARVRLFTRGEKGIYVNTKPYAEYFQGMEDRITVEESLKKMKSFERFRVSAKVSGGGIHAQSEAVRHGIARALTKFNPDFRKRLRRAGFLTRDPRM